MLLHERAGSSYAHWPAESFNEALQQAVLLLYCNERNDAHAVYGLVSHKRGCGHRI
jgi:hypothetical protein